MGIFKIRELVDIPKGMADIDAVALLKALRMTKRERRKRGSADLARERLKKLTRR